MKKKVILTGMAIFLVGIGSFFLVGGLNSFANELDSFNFEQAIEDGYVIQHNGDIINLIRFQEFFENVNRGIEDSIVVLVNPNSRDGKTYELHYRDDSLLLYYDISENFQGRKQYRIKEYESMTRLLRQDQIEFVLISGNTENSFLAYSLTN